jgi:hypothetical protein
MRTHHQQLIRAVRYITRGGSALSIDWGFGLLGESTIAMRVRRVFLGRHRPGGLS